jgi:hypothetical protein
MAQPTETFDSYDARGNREDLQDKIYMVSPEKVPVSSAIKRTKVTNRLHEWQRDSLATPNKDNAVIEGDDRSGTAITPTERVANTTQLFDKVVIVSEAQRKHNPAGRSDEMKYQLAMKAYPELKRDVEAAILSNNVAVQGNSTTARKLAGLDTLIFTNISHGASGATPAHTSGLATTAQTAGTNRAFAVTQLDTVMQSIYTNSGEMPTMVSMTPSHKTAFSAFTGIALNRKEAAKKEQVVITGGADVYVSNFGALTIVPNYVQATANPNTVYILNPEQLALGVFNPMNSRPLAKTGHADKELASIECTLVVQSQTAQGAIKNLTA